MSTIDFGSQTVVELRKYAKEHGIPLSKGMLKAEIVRTLEAAAQEAAKEAPDGSEQLSLFEETGKQAADKPAESADPGYDTEEDAQYTAKMLEPEEPVNLEIEPEDKPFIIHAAAPGPAIPGRAHPVFTAEEAPAEIVQEPDPTAVQVPFTPRTFHAPQAPVRPVVEKPVQPVVRPAQTEPQIAARAAQDTPKPTQEAGAQPQFRAVWRNPAPASGQHYDGNKQGYGQRNTWQASRTRASADTQTRPANNGFTPRFGPDVGKAAEPRTPSYMETARSRGFGPPRRTDAAENTETNTSPSWQPARESTYTAAPRRDPMELPPLNDLLQDIELQEGSGTLEVHPDGYGFLRTETLLPSQHDIYVSVPLIRRYALRSGDTVTGKLRPPRDGDKYKALLSVTSVNGQDAETLTARPNFEELTAAYTSRRLSLDCPDYVDVRLMDLLSPMGFGHRALMMFPPQSRKGEFLCHIAEAVRKNYPEAEVIMLLLDKMPEDVTMYRERVQCTLVSATFDQAPESQLRLLDLLLEKCMRSVESHRDVVLIVDSLTRLCKLQVSSTSAPAQRSSIGLVNPISLFRAKKLFGTGRYLKEGGSMTVIAAMDVETGNKVDDSIVEEFRETATLELRFDAALIRAGVYPPISFTHCRTAHPDLLLSQQEWEGLQIIRKMQEGVPPAQAVQQLLSMIQRVRTNSDMLLRMKDWAALMQNGRKV